MSDYCTSTLSTVMQKIGLNCKKGGLGNRVKLHMRNKALKIELNYKKEGLGNRVKFKLHLINKALEIGLNLNYI